MITEIEADPVRCATVAVSVRVYRPPGCNKPGSKTKLLFRVPVVLDVDKSSVSSSMVQEYST